MKFFTLSLLLSLLIVCPNVNAGVCRKIEGYVVGFDDKIITFQVLFKKKKLIIDQTQLQKEQLAFLKANVEKLIEECVPHASVQRMPASAKKKKRKLDV
jgi:hypothetical protein